MIVYIFLTIFLMLLSFIELYNNGYSTKIKVVLIILLCFIMGFRYNVGNDYHNYVDIYENLIV